MRELPCWHPHHGEAFPRSLLMNYILNLKVTPQIKWMQTILEMYAGDHRERLLLACILYVPAQSALEEMSEIWVTLSQFLMMRSTAIVPPLMASCSFLVVKEVNQVVIIIS
jgi:hypothetical protein